MVAALHHPPGTPGFAAVLLSLESPQLVIVVLCFFTRLGCASVLFHSRYVSKSP
ncbi:hypothetical protein BDW60DRAFT_188673 [Aspergillus nidulans var. acristatus]